MCVFVCVCLRNTDAWSFHCQDLYDYNESEQALFFFVYKEYPMPWRQRAGSGWFSDLRWWLSLRLIHVLTLQVRTIYPSLITCLSCYKWKTQIRKREREKCSLIFPCNWKQTCQPTTHESILSLFISVQEFSWHNSKNFNFSHTKEIIDLFVNSLVWLQPHQSDFCKLN